jgi:hypothetical protein
MTDKPSDTRFDVRMIEARLRRGGVTAAEYEKHLASLPDEAEFAEPSRVAFQSSYADKNYRR